MNETEFDQWQELVAASDANAVALDAGVPNDVAGERLRAALSLWDRPFGAGLYGLARAHFDRVRQCHELELGAAHLAANRYYDRAISELCAERDRLLVTLEDATDDGLVAASRLRVMSEKLGGEGGLDRFTLYLALDRLRGAGHKPGVRHLIDLALELEAAHDASLMRLIEFCGLPVGADDCYMSRAFWLLDTLVWAAEGAEDLERAHQGFIERALVALQLDDDPGVNEVAAWHHQAMGREFPVWLEDQIVARLEPWDENDVPEHRLVRSLKVDP